MTMNVLFVYSAAKFKIESPIEFLRNGKSTEVIEPGVRVLAPGVYRFSGSVGVTAVDQVNGSLGDAQILPAPEDKTGWPDPPLLARVTGVLGVSRRDLVDFLGGTNVQSDV